MRLIHAHFRRSLSHGACSLQLAACAVWYCHLISRKADFSSRPTVGRFSHGLQSRGQTLARLFLWFAFLCLGSGWGLHSRGDGFSWLAWLWPCHRPCLPSTSCMTGRTTRRVTTYFHLSS